MLKQNQAPANIATAGFTLAEVAVVLVILGLILGGLLTALPQQVHQQRTEETQSALNEQREALMGYALANGYLPCPDVDTDGQEDVVAISQCNTIAFDARCASTDGNQVKGQASDLANQRVCTAMAGRLPSATLATHPVDGWHNRISYHADPAYSNHSAGPSLTSLATLRVCADRACTQVLANNLPAVLISHGANGLGAVNGQHTPNAQPAGDDELENTDADALFTHHEVRTEGGAGGEFDDQLSWIPATLLLNRLVAAGQLP